MDVVQPSAEMDHLCESTGLRACQIIVDAATLWYIRCSFIPLHHSPTDASLCSATGLQSHLFHVTDCSSGLWFLVDTGAKVLR